MTPPTNTNGQLHIFFGAAPGVGKTWAMVDAAQQKRAEEADVIIGFINMHDRSAFAGLLDGLEIVPPLVIEYQGVCLNEMNLDAILERRPEIVLIDELAHSNLPGARNARRYQDVIELLQAGINVYTTINLPQVSSVALAIANLTGIPVREQVPDFVLEMASSIRLIDLAAEELLNRLLKRLQPGDESSGGLFEPVTLVTLRELALRLAAVRVDDADVRKSRAGDPWASSPRILVGISGSPSNEHLIRATNRLATEMNTTWLAVHIQTPGDNRLDSDAQRRIQAHLQLAKTLGAETLSVAGESVAGKLVQVAEQYNAARVVVGRSNKRGSFSRVRSLADEIMDLSDNLDVLILRGGFPPYAQVL